ncbi:MAG: hypothetical protein IJ274_01990 [Lachnospiraceae bacterium]|nr:hypothetical protein [Lachnospiraceae bacterium]
MNKLKWFCLIGAIVTILVGIISHFVYEWSGNNFLVGLFFPVNESIWEHMKLIFFPMFAYALIAGKKVEEQYPCIYDAMFQGILAGLAMIPVLFYTYTGILGFDVAWINIAVYIISVLFAYLVVYKKAETCIRKDSKILRYLMYVFLVAFMVFSVYPPGIGLFVSP